MQDFDYTRIYSNPRKDFSTVRSGSHPVKSLNKRFSVYISVSLVIFFAGFIAGVKVEHNKIARVNNTINSSSADLEKEINSSNISNPKSIVKTEENKKETSAPSNTELLTAIQSEKSEYLILAKIFTSKEEAHLHGLKLKKNGLPVFLAESGTRMKVYVGPISGKNEAYQVLAQVKSDNEFKGAILYKK